MCAPKISALYFATILTAESGNYMEKVSARAENPSPVSGFFFTENLFWTHSATPRESNTF